MNNKKNKVSDLSRMSVEARYMGMTYGYWSAIPEHMRKAKLKAKMKEDGITELVMRK